MSNIQISLEPADDIATNNPMSREISNKNKYNYTKDIEQILTAKFSEFGVFKDFENLIISTNSIYCDFDEITTYDRILQINLKLRRIILNKMDKFRTKEAILRYQLEIAMISLVNEEIDFRVFVSKK
jgi:hypothetical protein